MGTVLAMKGLISSVCVVALTALAGCQPVVQKLTGTPPESKLSAPTEALSGPVMQVQIPSRGANAELRRVAVNKDVETWWAIDNTSLSFQRGVLVATRGLGFDLMGADAQNTLTAIEGFGEKTYRRQMRYLTGEHHSAYLNAACSITVVGPETIDGQRLRRLEEQCQTRSNLFTNLFWLNESDQITRSRQWVSPKIGYLSTNIRSR